MTEQQYIDFFTARWPRAPDSVEPTLDTIAALDKAVLEHPRSAKLWVIRGCLLQLCDCELETHPPSEALRSFTEAIKVSPQDPDAYFEAGCFLSSVMSNRRKAKQYFRKASLLRRAQPSAAADRPLAGARGRSLS